MFSLCSPISSTTVSSARFHFVHCKTTRPVSLAFTVSKAAILYVYPSREVAAEESVVWAEWRNFPQNLSWLIHLNEDSLPLLGASWARITLPRRQNTSHHVLSCYVMSCHVMSCHVMSCHVMSCHVTIFGCT